MSWLWMSIQYELGNADITNIADNILKEKISVIPIG